jgi:flagellar biosynthesis regulator FlaF
MRVYVVTENEFDKELIESLLSRRFGKSAREICVRAATNKHNAWSSVDSLLLNKRIPTALVVDADTIDHDLTQEQRGELEELFSMSAPKHMWLIVLAQPEPEAVFFSDRAMLERITGKKVSELDIARAALGPRAALQKLLPKPRSGHGAKQLVKKLSESDFEKLLSSEVFRPLIDFIQRQLSSKEPLPPRIHRSWEKEPWTSSR